MSKIDNFGQDSSLDSSIGCASAWGLFGLRILARERKTFRFWIPIELCTTAQNMVRKIGMVPGFCPAYYDLEWAVWYWSEWLITLDSIFTFFIYQVYYKLQLANFSGNGDHILLPHTILHCTKMNKMRNKYSNETTIFYHFDKCVIFWMKRSLSRNRCLTPRQKREVFLLSNFNSC